MISLNIRKPIIAFIPLIVLIPMFFQILTDLHLGGIQHINNFLLSAFNPSLDQDIINSSLRGIQVTFSIAMMAWAISITFGLILGVISSNTFYRIINKPKLIAKVNSYILAIPRATHELLCGLLLLEIFGLEPWVAILSISIPYSALMARVFSLQIDSLEFKKINSLKQCGASIPQLLVSALLPKLIPIIATHGSYRLECAVRAATLLGVFGLGGIGTDLRLSFMSLNFHEMWTSLWILILTTFFLEKGLQWLQKPSHYKTRVGIYSLSSTLLILLSFIISMIWINSLNIGIQYSYNINNINLPNINDLTEAFHQLPIFTLTIQTIVLTLLASSVAIGMAPLSLMLFQRKNQMAILSLFWVFCRTLPLPITAMLLLLTTTPSVSVASLALGIHHMGAMGRILNDNISKQKNDLFEVLQSVGSPKNSSWLYGKLSPESNSYLSYAAYRTDVILRDTIVVGVAGSFGLGWQLKESLSSFAWGEVLLIASLFISITIIGEICTEVFQRRLVFMK